MKWMIVLAIAVASFTADAQQTGNGLPPGKWWDRPEVVRRLELTDTQRTQLEKIFRTSASDLIDLKADVEKRSLALRSQMDESKLNRQSIQGAAARLGEARARLFERELMMFVDMRGVLSDAQWTRFRDSLAERQERLRERRTGPAQRQQQPKKQPRRP